VFFRGGGLFGRHRLELVTVHYAGAYTAYGPIRPADQGLSFFTLRDAWDPGARFLPAHKDELRLARVARRETLAGPLAVPDGNQLQVFGQVTCQTLIESADDALGAWCQLLPPGGTPVVPALAGSGGQFWLLLGGSLHWPGRPPLPHLSCVYVAAGDQAPATRAGADGAVLLVLRLPERIRPSACTTEAAGAQAPAASG
jgi:hypothetical protein